MKKKRFDVVIAGAGIVGVACGLALQARGLRVAIVDPAEPRRRASFGHGGMISRISIFPMASPAVKARALAYALNRDAGLRIRYTALPALAPWLARFWAACDEGRWRTAAARLNPLIGAARRHHDSLAQELGLTELIRPVGWVKAYRTPEGFSKAALERELLAQHGIGTTILEMGELADLEPSLRRRFHKGMWSSDSGYVRSPWAYLDRLQAAFLERGGDLLRGEVRAAREVEDKVRVETSADPVEAAHFVVAAGAWSHRILRSFGIRIIFGNERGYYRHFALPAGVALGRPVYDVEGGYSLHPTDVGVRICGGVELARLDDAQHPDLLDNVTPEARRTLPMGEVIEDDWMGPRPSTPDGLPVIGWAPGSQQIVLAFGHGHSGFGTGPLTGAIVADLICGRAPEVDISPFSVERLARRRSVS